MYLKYYCELYEMLNVSRAIKIILLFSLASAMMTLAEESFLESTEEDSTVTEDASAEDASADSIRYYRPPKPPKQKSYNIHMTERMVKSNLARLSYYAEGSYLNPLFALEDIFIQANEFPEEIKNKMFGLAIAGGVAREAFKHTRKQLYNRNIRFIYPNLSGLNVTSSLPMMNARMHVRAMSLTDRYYRLILNRGKFYIFYRERPRVTQRGLNYRLFKRVRLFAQRTEYKHTVYNGFGLSHSTKKFYLYAMFTQNPDRPINNRVYLYLNIHFD
jgi:hypothetical protein